MVVAAKRSHVPSCLSFQTASRAQRACQVCTTFSTEPQMTERFGDRSQQRNRRKVHMRNLPKQRCSHVPTVCPIVFDSTILVFVVPDAALTIEWPLRLLFGGKAEHNMVPMSFCAGTLQRLSHRRLIQCFGVFLPRGSVMREVGSGADMLFM